MDARGLSLNEAANGSVYLTLGPEPERAPFDAQALGAWLASQGYGDCQPQPEALAQAVAQGRASEGPLVLLVAQRVDARVEVGVAPDAMQARLCIFPAQGGRPATLDMLHAALAQAGVVYGLDPLALERALAHGKPEATLVAQGRPPIDGQDAEFLELLPAAPERTPRLDARGRIDYRAHSGGIVLVRADAMLMRRRPATAGTPGRTVRGDALVPRPGRDEPFALRLSGAVVSDDDPDLLLACISGQPVRVRAGMRVEPVLHLPEVGLAQGNLHYDGTVRIDGDVAQGMHVQASGDILVGGTVDGAVLHAGGEIRIGGGVIAHAQLHAEGALHARFAEASALRAGTLLAIEQSALQCRLESLHEIVVGTQAPQRGRLVGGSASAMMLVKAPLLGAHDAGVTRLTLGVNPVLQERLLQLRELLEKHAAAAHSLAKLIAQLGQAGDPKDLLGRASASLEHTRTQQAQGQAEHDALAQQLARTRGARVDIGMALEGAVDLTLCRQRVALRRDYGSGSLQLNAEGALVHVDTRGLATALQP